MSDELNDLQGLIERFERAREQRDAQALDRLNEEVRPCVNAAMAGVNEGRVSTAAVREAVERLQSLARELVSEAETERDEAVKELKDVRHNQSAVKAYGSVNRK